MKVSMTFGAGFIAAFCAIAAAAVPVYHVDHETPLAGDDGWDYLNADARSGHLFVTHGTQVQVLNLADLSAVGTIAGIKGAHGVALAEDLGRGYISAGRSDTVVVFDLKTLARVQEIKTSGGNPDAILYDAATHQLFTFNGRGKNATVIDARDNSVVATIALQAKPEFAVDDLAGHIYVNLEDTNSLAMIDTVTHSLVKTWKLPGCDEPTGLAIDREHGRLFSVCSNKSMLIVDATSGKVVAKLPIGDEVDGVAFDPASGLAFASGGDGTMTVVHEDTPQKFVVAQTVTTKAGARTVTVDEKTHRVYTVTATLGAADKTGGRPKVLPGTFVVLTLDR